MKRLMIILGTILVLSTGCITQQRCNQLFPPKVTDTIIVKDSVSVKDTIITILRDTVAIEDTIPCPDYEKEIKGLRSHIKVLIKDHKLTATCICDSIELKLQQYTYWHSIEHNHTELRTINPKKISWWRQTIEVGGYIFFGLILLAIAYGIYKFIKFIKPKL